MQNSYTKEGQFNWWLVRILFPSKLKIILIFTPARKPAQLEGPRAGPWALDISRVRPDPAY